MEALAGLVPTMLLDSIFAGSYNVTKAKNGKG
jgi:hypothetical protein